MAIYAIWNNKGGVGKSYLAFQLACEYAFQHPDRKVLVVDACPQANASVMLLGGAVVGESVLSQLAASTPLRTISGYVEERIRSPYVNPLSGGQYAIQARLHNQQVPDNVYVVPGDEQLEVQASRVVGAANPGPQDAWRLVHDWFNDLIQDIVRSLDGDVTVFIDCNPSFTIYTELALSASERLIVPFTADGASRRAVRSVLALVYGVQRNPGAQVSQYHLNATAFRTRVPLIYCYVGNRLTQNLGPATAFGSVVQLIGREILAVWRSHPNRFAPHPANALAPRTDVEFRRMFQAELRDANTAAVVSTALGIPLRSLVAGRIDLFGRVVKVNQSQLDSLVPNMTAFVGTVE